MVFLENSPPFRKKREKGGPPSGLCLRCGLRPLLSSSENHARLAAIRSAVVYFLSTPKPRHANTVAGMRANGITLILSEQHTGQPNT